MKFASEIGFLERQQRLDGSILGKASADPSDFSNFRTQPTIFFSALILECLRNIPGATKLRCGLTDSLLANRSEGWSWNYWLRSSRAHSEQPYPDDLDDTCCSLSALYHYNPDLLDGKVASLLVQQLLTNETQPGGPYETWLIDKSAKPEWHDIDIAVNANIGYCLSLLGVSLPGLDSYIASGLASHKLSSKYYCGDIPVIYFLTRWYRGTHSKYLQNKVRKYTIAYQSLNALELALIITSALHCDFEQSTIQPLVNNLYALQEHDHWPAAAFYGEPAIEGVPYYAGSEALTTAFALEALQAFNKSSQQPVSPRPHRRHLPRHLQIELPTSDLKDTYQQLLRRIAKTDCDGQITRIASLTANALDMDIQALVTERLNAASIHGWMAYTIYDNVWDQQANPLQLGVANSSLRHSQHLFVSAVPNATDYHKLVNKTLITVDAANTWEAHHARATVDGNSIRLRSLPDYGRTDNYGQLAARSWGHMLAAAGAYQAVGYTVDSQEQSALRDFFHHFLVARQLNDDAHDWEVDLRHGHLSAVVCMLLKDVGSVDLQQDIEVLRQQFWQTTIDQVADRIYTHLDMATAALAGCPFKDASVFLGWLSELCSATDQAIAQRDQTLDFITAFAPSAGATDGLEGLRQ